MTYKLAIEVTLSDSGFLFDHSSGQTYTLNATGQFLFRQIEQGIEEENLMKNLLLEFDIDEATAKRDLDDFFRQLKEYGIL